MSCENIPSISDLEKTKLHIDDFGRLIGGTESGYSTSGVTGKTRPTYDKIIADLGFKPGSGDFTTGFTVQPGQRDYAWYDPVSKNWYSYLGVIPPGGYVVIPGTNPVSNIDWKPVTDAILREDIARLNIDVVADMVGITVGDVGKRVQWAGYYVASDGGGNWGIVKTGAHVHDGGRIFTITPTLYVEANLKGGRISILKFGAKADSTSASLVTNNGPIVEKIVAYLKTTNGGEIYVPPVGALDRYYGLSTSDENRACVFIDTFNITISGSGDTSVFKTYNNAHVPIHVCHDPDLSIVPDSSIQLSGFHCDRISVRGTGTYQNFGLAKGRGILLRHCKNSSVTRCTINDMSMIGICSEHGQGNLLIHGNIIRDCKYSAININGRGYQSIISSNICSGSNGDSNSTAIQANGPSLVNNNSIYGSVTDYANCGGIMWGEGNFDGIGGVTNNLITHCRYGIKSIFHGSCNITGNTLINCRTTGGITAIGGTGGGFTVASSHNNITANTLINCAPYQIECSAENCNIVGNVVRNIATPKLPSAPSEPDAIFPVTVQVAIRVRAPGCAVIGNKIDGAERGISTTIGQDDGAIYGNSISNTTSGTYVMEGDAGKFIPIASRERRVLGSTSIDDLVSAAIPSAGYFSNASVWKPSGYTIGQPMNAIVLQARIDSLSSTAASGATTINIVGAATFTTGTNSKIGIKLDDGTYHWTTIAANSGNTITLAAAIPAGRSAPSGNPVYVNVWRPGANLV